MRLIAVFAFACLGVAACSGNGGSGADVGEQLAELAGKAGTVVVVRDTADMYWAVPTSGVRHAGGHTLAVRPGTTVAGGAGEGSPEAVAQLVLDQWPDGGPYFMSEGGGVKANGQVGDATEEILLE